MARITALSPFDLEFFGGTGEFAVAAGTLFALVRALDERAPGFAAQAEPRVTFAVGGVVVNDWSHALATQSEVLILPRVGGGQG